MSFDFIDYAKSRDFGDIHVKIDNETGLVAIIAIHSTTLGPALGGCRCIEYPNSAAAVEDALRLARAMSYKAAMVDLPHGGGKSVLMRPAEIKDRKAYFEAFGRFVNELNGRYITAVDSGSTVADMDVIATQTPYVTSVTSMSGDHTSLFTALGVKIGIEAAFQHRLGDKSVEGKHIAIQGVGAVGYYLARELHQAGAKLTVTDVSEAAIQRCIDEFGATAVSSEAIYSVSCDAFAPCALGAVINENSLAQLDTGIIAGSANNQLATMAFGKQVFERGILYAPDYVINAGGLIYAAGKFDGESDERINERLNSIYHSLIDIFERSEREGIPSNDIADTIAREKL